MRFSNPNQTPEEARRQHSREMAKRARIVGWAMRVAVAVPVILLLGLVAQCEFHPEAAKQSVEDDTAIFQAQAQIRALLRDPASAEFSAVRRRGGAVCGMVNSRNGFGGMTGPRRFLAGSYVGIEPAEPDEHFEATWSRQC